MVTRWRVLHIQSQNETSLGGVRWCIKHSFRGRVWRYQGPAGWYFVTLPKRLAARIRKLYGASEEGWGRLKTRARVGKTEWETAIWYDAKAGSYLLPFKYAIRKTEILKEESTVQVTLELKKSQSIKRTAPHHVWATTEEALLENLSEDLVEAFQKLKAFARSLGEQRVYAAGKAIMFSRDVCYFFVRPKKSYLETVIFLFDSERRPGFHSVKAVSKAKYSHTFKLVHADQVEGDLTEAIRTAFQLSSCPGRTNKKV